TTYGLAIQWGTQAGLEKFFFLGSGLLYGVACEAMLKMKEMSITQSEAYHALEFRHGPKAMVDDSALVVGLLTRRTFDHEAAVLHEMAAMGGTTLALAPGTRSAGHITVHLPDDLPEWVMPVLYLPVLQSMAHARAVSKGLDPDNPRNLTAVVRLDRAALR
ncbi:MAG TPA: SIS domain-containing protein, partial [Anaerolineales bacterium]